MATRIYVGNLPYTADNTQLSELFSAFGEVVDVAVVMDRESGRSKGFGFVQLASETAAQDAIVGLNGTMLGNRAIRVNEAQPRSERVGGFRSGGDFSERPRRESGYGDTFGDPQDRYGRRGTSSW
ncbi:MAG TPA: RNA-binding protein [Ktedonobacterales bacterium]|jgi:RNA recognition motif-containing protein|nr:RNA-binding protein [Ktedonobacterales bacterium]